MKAIKPRLDTDGLSECGLWVRRLRPAPGLVEEAGALCQVIQTWNLWSMMDVDRYDCAFAEVSAPDLPPAWVYLVELVGRRTEGPPLIPNHPLSRVPRGEPVRLVALVRPDTLEIPGALVEAGVERRLLWQQVTSGAGISRQ